MFELALKKKAVHHGQMTFPIAQRRTHIQYTLCQERS